MAANAAARRAPTFSSCRGSRTCGGAATRWSWNRRAPARCSGFAIRRSRPPWPCCPHRNRSNGSVGRTVFRGSSCSPCWSIARSCSRSTPARDSGLRPAEGDDNLVLWDFHDLLFHARSTEGRHANPMGGLYPYAGVMAPLPAVRPRWPGKKIDLRKVSAADRAGQSRRPRSSCVNVIRRASSMTSDRSRSPSFRGFSTAPRVSSRDGAAGSTSATTLRWSRMPPGRIRRAAAATSSSSIWPSTNAKGWRADSIITTPADMRWCRSACAPHELDALLAGAEFAMGAPAAAPDPDHDRGALWPDVMEIQLDRLCAHPEGCRRIDCKRST